MAMTVEQLVVEVLSLSSESRAFLAERLVGSLDASDFVDQTEVDDLWAAEAQRRLEDVRAGRVATISGEEVAARVRRALG